MKLKCVLLHRSCGQRFTCTHYGHECHGNLGNSSRSRLECTGCIFNDFNAQVFIYFRFSVHTVNSVHAGSNIYTIKRPLASVRIFLVVKAPAGYLSGFLGRLGGLHLNWLVSWCRPGFEPTLVLWGGHSRSLYQPLFLMHVWDHCLVGKPSFFFFSKFQMLSVI